MIAGSCANPHPDHVAFRRLVATPISLHRQMMDKRLEIACGQIQSRHSGGQLETPRPSASRIEMEHPANSLDPGLMRVTANDDVNPARDWIQLQCFDVMQDIDATPAEGDHLGLRITFRPWRSVDVPSDRNDGRDPLQCCDNVWRTDVAGMDDMRHACEELLNFRTQQPVSVRDDSNSDHCAGIPRARMAAYFDSACSKNFPRRSRT